MRYAGLHAKAAVMKDTVRLIFVGRVWQKKGAFDALLGKTGMGSWANYEKNIS
jgi:hypothetical protein